MESYAVRDFKRLLRRLFKRAARFLWCNPFDVAWSMRDTALWYAAVASSLLFFSINLSNFLIDERSAERMLMLCIRRFTFCRVRFLAWGEFAKWVPRVLAVLIERGNMGNFGCKVKSTGVIF